MSDVNTLNTSTYYAGVQSAGFSVAKDQKKQKINNTRTTKFGDVLKETQLSAEMEAAGLPKEIQSMTVEEAAVFLKDAVDIAGDKIKEKPTMENLQEFKKSVQHFVRFVVLNNYEITKKNKKGFSAPMQFFSNYNTKLRPKDPRVNVELINKNLDNLARSMIQNQKDNLKLLAQIDEIKGLIVDLMQA